MAINKIYVDMDGVLVDFERGIRELCHIEPPKQGKEHDPKDVERMYDAMRNVDHFYDKLEPIPGSIEMLKSLRDKYGDRIGILTAVPKPERNILHAAEDKVRWMYRMLDDYIPVHVVLRKDKPSYCHGHEDILIDDYYRNVEAWEDVGGLGVLFTGVEDTMKTIDAIENSRYEHGVIRFAASYFNCNRVLNGIADMSKEDIIQWMQEHSHYGTTYFTLHKDDKYDILRGDKYFEGQILFSAPTREFPIFEIGCVDPKTEHVARIRDLSFEDAADTLKHYCVLREQNEKIKFEREYIDPYEEPEYDDHEDEIE